ncbi:MAG: hypothetical protein GEU80_17085 [Dehalococcoidia bacterium]|nr:hypothetical protein [Dehalococcoidia bacterium]
MATKEALLRRRADLDAHVDQLIEGLAERLGMERPPNTAEAMATAGPNASARVVARESLDVHRVTFLLEAIARLTERTPDAANATPNAEPRVTPPPGADDDVEAEADTDARSGTKGARRGAA